MSRARTIGAYQPRTRRAAMADTFDDLHHALLRFVATVLLRGAAAVLFLGSAAGLVALASYSPRDASLNNATARASANLLGSLGATAADLLLQTFGLAALAALAAPAVWGALALAGKGLRFAGWRALAWPLGTIFAAGGLAMLPAPLVMPAGAGGLIGLAVAGLARHLAHSWHQGWIVEAVPIALFAAGLPLAFFATGLRIEPIWRAAAQVAAFLVSGAGFLTREVARQKAAPIEEEPWNERGDTTLDIVPEPAGARTGERSGETRIKRDEVRKPLTRPKPVRQAALDLGESEYQLPPLGLLAEPVRVPDRAALSDEALEENARMLEAVLADFGVRGRIVAVRPGPVVTLYEFEPAAGVKSSRVISLSDDVARSMSAVAARIAVIPGRNVLGIELPNLHRQTVFLRELVGSGEYEKARAPLVLALGNTIGGEAVMADLAKMPHLLIAGTTGSGKSVALNTMILSLLFRLPPDQARMIFSSTPRCSNCLYTREFRISWRR